MNININIKQRSAGTPNMDITNIVNIFIGIIKPIGCTSIL